jgi:hypothetical protein
VDVVKPYQNNEEDPLIEKSASAVVAAGTSTYARHNPGSAFALDPATLSHHIAIALLFVVGDRSTRGPLAHVQALPMMSATFASPLMLNVLWSIHI